MAKKVKSNLDIFDDEFEFFPLEEYDDGEMFGEVKDRKGIKYVKNVLKSVKNLAVTIGADAFPETSGLLKGFGEAGAEFKDAFTTYKDKAVDFLNKKKGESNKLNSGNIGNEAESLFKSIKDDIVGRFKSGYFIKSLEDSIDLDSMMDDDFGSFNNADDGSGGISATTKEKKVIDPNAPSKLRISKKKKLYETTLKLENERFQSVNQSVLTSSQAIVSSSVELFEKAQMMEEARHHVHVQYLKNIATNIYKHTTMQAQLLQANIEYGKKSLAIYSEQLSHLKEMREIQSILYRKQENTGMKNKNPSIKDIFGNGFDGAAYAKAVMGNMQNEFGMFSAFLPMLGMLNSDMLGGGKGGGMNAKTLGTMLFSAFNPINFLFNNLLSGRMKGYKGKVERMFKSIPALINQKLVGKRYENGFTGFLSRILGVREEETVVNIERFSDMNLDAPTAFDVRTKRTITEVIPNYLAQIAAALTGREEMRYDFKNQSFKTVSAIKRGYEIRQEQALNADIDFSQYSNKIKGNAIKKYNKAVAAGKIEDNIGKDELFKAFDTIRKRIVNLQRGLDLKKSYENQAYRSQLMRDIKVKGATEQEKDAKKERILNLFLAGYSNLTPDERQLFKAAAVRVKGDIDSANKYNIEELMRTYSGGGSALASSNKEEQIAAKQSELARLQEEKQLRLNQKFVGSKERQALEKKNLELKFKRDERLLRRQIESLKNSSADIVGANTVSVDNENDYLNASRYLSVPNMLKNITEILLNGIIVYPQNKIPDNVIKNIETQSKYLSSTFSLKNIKDIKKQKEEAELERENLLLEEVEDMKTARKISYGIEGRLSKTKAGKFTTKMTGHLLNAMQEIASSIAGFDASYDYTKTEEENAASYDKTKADSRVKRTLKKGKESGNAIISKVTGFIDKYVSGADSLTDKDFNVVLQDAGVLEKANSSLNKLKNKLITEASKIGDNNAVELIKNVVSENKDKPVAALKQLQEVIAPKIISGVPVDNEDIDRLENNGVDIGDSADPSGMIAGFTTVAPSNATNIKQNIVNKKNKYKKVLNKTVQKVRSTTNNIIDQSQKVVNRSINKVNNIQKNFSSNLSVDLSTTETKLDRIIEILEKQFSDAKDVLKGPYDVTGIDEIIALLVSINAKEFSVKDISEIEKAIDARNKKLKKPSLLGRLIKFPFRVAGHVASGAGSLFGGAGSGIGNFLKGLLPGAGNALGGALGGIGNFFGSAKKGIGGFFSAAASGIGGLFGGGAKGLGKAIGGTVGGITGAIGGLFKINKNGMNKELAKLSMSEGGLTLERLLSEYNRDKLLKFGSLILDLKIDDPKLVKMSDEKLAKVILKYWKNTGGGKNTGGIKDVVGGVAGLAGKLFGGAGKAGSTVLGAAGNALQTVGAFLFGKKGDKANKLKNFEKGVLGNLIAIRMILENHYGPANAGKVAAELSKYESTGGAINAIKNAIGKPFKAIGGLFGFVKNGARNLAKKAGFIDRGDGSGIREGSWADAKKDMEEAKALEREENKVEYLLQIAENTSILAKKVIDEKYKRDKDDESDEGGLNIYDIASNVMDYLPGRNRRNRRNRRRRNRRNRNRIRNRNRTRNRKPGTKRPGKKNMFKNVNNITKRGGGKLGKILSGGGKLLAGAGAVAGVATIGSNLMAMKNGEMSAKEFATDTTEVALQNVQASSGILLKFFNIFKSGLAKLLSNPKIAAMVGKQFMPQFLKTFAKGLFKFGANLTARITAGLATTAGSVGISLAVQATAGWYWGLARAKAYFPTATQITLPMRITSGLVKAIDFLGYGIPGIIFDLLGMNIVEFIYTLISKMTAGTTAAIWKETRAGLYGLKNGADLDKFLANKSIGWQEMNFTCKEVFDAWIQRRFEPLNQMEMSLAPNEDLIDGSSSDRIAVENYRNGFKKEAKAYLNKNKIKDLTYKTTKQDFDKKFSEMSDENLKSAENKEKSSAEKTPLGQQVSSKLQPFFSGALSVASTIGEVAKSKWDKVKDFTKEKFDSVKEKFSKVASFIGTGIKNVWTKGTEFAGNMVSKGKEVAGNLITKGQEFIGNVGQKIGAGAVAVGSGIALAGGTLVNKIKQFTTRVKSSILGKEADVDNLHPLMKERLAGLSEEYYQRTGKKLKINQAYRSMHDQAIMKQQLGAKAASPSWRATHTNGIAVDIDTGVADYLDSSGLLKKYGLWRPLWKPYNASYPESWHIELEGSRPILAGNKPGLPDKFLNEMGISESKPYNPAEYGAVASPATMEIVNSQSEPYKESIGVSDAESKTISDEEKKQNQNNNVSSTPIKNHLNNISQQPRSGVKANTSSSASVANAGVQGVMSTAASVDQTVKIMNKVEENTRKTYEILAKHLPNLDTMTRLLAGILAISQMKQNGGTVNSETMDSLAGILAKG